MKIGIAGAGIMGLWLAYRLIKAGYEIDIFDREENRTTCSQAASGMLSVTAELEKAPWLIYQLGREALDEHWPAFIKEMGKTIYFKQSGSIAISHPLEKTALMKFQRDITSKFQGKEIAVPLKMLSAAEIIQLEPELQTFDQGLYLPTDAQIDSQAVMTTLLHYVQCHGIKWHAENVLKFNPHLIETENDQYLFDVVVDCRGLGARAFFSDLLSVRGELIWVHAPTVNISRPIRFQHPRYPLYIVPRPNHIYLLGATEIFSDSLANINVRSTLELLTAAYSVHAGFIEAEILKTVSQCRPMFRDALPRIHYETGLIAINGLYRHGFLIAPALANDVCHRLADGVQNLQFAENGVYQYAS